MKIRTFNLHPIFNSKLTEWGPMGLYRDRKNDEFKWVELNKTQEIELTEPLKKVLIEDICEYYTGKRAYIKLKEFDLLK